METILQKSNFHLINNENGNDLIFKVNTLSLFRVDRIASDILKQNFPMAESKLIFDLSNKYKPDDISDG